MLDEKVKEWLRTGKRGVSSEAIVSVMEGIPLNQYGLRHPVDPSDFMRCYLLLEAVPEYRSRLKEMRTVSNEWMVLVDHWEELEALYREEAEQEFATKLYHRMRELLFWNVPFTECMILKKE